LDAAYIVDSKEPRLTSPPVQPIVRRCVRSRRQTARNLEPRFADKVGYSVDKGRTLLTACIEQRGRRRIHLLHGKREHKQSRSPSSGSAYTKLTSTAKFFTSSVTLKRRLYFPEIRWTNPTDVAVAANGDIYIVDGYGSQKVSRFDKNFKHVKQSANTRKRSGGSKCSARHVQRLPRIWINTLKSEPEVYIAPTATPLVLRVYSLELEYSAPPPGDVRNPAASTSTRQNFRA